MKRLREIISTGQLVPLIVLFLSLCVLDNILAATRSDEMRVTLPGTGTLVPNAERFGSAIPVEVAGKRLLFDCGRGVVIRLTQAGVSPKDIDDLFLTHLHSDHVVGIPDLWLSGWFLGRDRSLPIWGPARNSLHGEAPCSGICL
jgi:ribonuclease Z